MPPSILSIKQPKELVIPIDRDIEELADESYQTFLCQSDYFTFLSTLLPYDAATKTKARLREGLKEYLFLVLSTEKVLIAVQKGELTRFDPLVGENACQIRALKIALLFSNPSLDLEKLQERVCLVKDSIYAIFNRIEYWVRQPISLEQLLEEGNLDISLTQDQLFFVETYVLTIVKTQKSSGIINPLLKNEFTDKKKIKDLLEVGTVFATELINLLRERVSNSSVLFVQSLASKLPLSDIKGRMLSDCFTIMHTRNQSLKCLPYYWTTRILVQESLNAGIPIVLMGEQKAKDREYRVVDKVKLFFKATPTGYQYVQFSQLDRNSAALILEGTTCDDFDRLANHLDWEADLIKKGPVDLLSAYSAAHRQYPDPSQESILADVKDPEYEYYKQKATEWGCKMDDARCFFLSHAYCDKLSNIEVPQLVSC